MKARGNPDDLLTALKAEDALEKAQFAF